jgi:hypothetical protein
MRYLIAVLDDRTNSVTPGEAQAINAFNDKLEAAGHRILAAGLVAPEDGLHIDNRNGVGLAETGTSLHTDLYRSGFWIIEAPDDHTAKALALEASLACNRQIDVRRFL